MMKLKMMLVAVVLSSAVNIVSAAVVTTDMFGSGANEFTIDFVDISGDTNPVRNPGVVNNDYRMGKLEISNDQWNKFRASYGKVTGNPLHAYDSSAFYTGKNVPTNQVSWYEVAQFVNYLNTSTGHQAAYKFTGTQGTSNFTMSAWEVLDTGYDSSNPFRNSNSKYFIPTENEWVKAAYWNGKSLQTYSNALASDLVSGTPNPVKWNYEPSLGSTVWDVDKGAIELNGTQNMMGNVLEWMEGPYNYGGYSPDYFRGVRGGAATGRVDALKLYAPRNYASPDNEIFIGGFRVASTVPEPCSLALLGLGSLVLRRKRH